jgi:O-antigen ligase
VLILAWGALSFGAVYPWGYIPLAAAAAVTGMLTLVLPRRAGRPIALAIALPLAAVGVAAALQLVPLRIDTLVAISPATAGVLLEQKLGFALVARQPGTLHALSIDTDATGRALLLFASFALLLVGLTRVVDGRVVRRLVPSLAVLGVLLSIVGLTQRSLYPGFGAKIYGVWTPVEGMGFSFAPFINRNHFAGWMLMAIPLLCGYIVGIAAADRSPAARNWRERIVRLSGKSASQATIVGIAAFVMVVALVASLSRSGISCLGVALTLAGVVVSRPGVTRSRRAWMLVSVALALAVAVGWTGVDALAGRFVDAHDQLGGRVLAWRDAWRVFRAFPVAGTGLNTYGDAMLLYQTAFVGAVHYAEAHNDYLQILAEGGVLVAIPAVVALGAVAWQIRQRFRDATDDVLGYWVRVGATTALVAIGLQEVMEFSLQMPGNAALFAVVCAIALRRSSPHRVRPLSLMRIASGRVKAGLDRAATFSRV